MRLLTYFLSLILLAILFTASSCEKKEPDTRDPHDERCGYLLPDNSLYDICVDNPFPTTLHPATDTGANTISCWINDTIAFRNWKPWLMGLPDAEGRRFDEDSSQFQIFGTYENFQEIDTRRITLYVPYSHPDTLRWRSTVMQIDGFSEISGAYEISYDHPISINNSSLNSEFVSGEFDFYVRNKNDTTRILHLSDGQFDVNWYWF